MSCLLPRQRKTKPSWSFTVKLRILYYRRRAPFFSPLYICHIFLSLGFCLCYLMFCPVCCFPYLRKFKFYAFFKVSSHVTFLYSLNKSGQFLILISLPSLQNLPHISFILKLYVVILCHSSKLDIISLVVGTVFFFHPPFLVFCREQGFLFRGVVGLTKQ